MPKQAQQAKLPMPSDDEEPIQWRAESLTLVTEIRTCLCCGTVHRVPNNKLLVEYESATTFRRRQYKPSSDNVTGLFRRKIEVHSKTQACEKCFYCDKEGERRPPRNVPRNLKRPHKKPAPKPLRLEDL